MKILIGAFAIIGVLVVAGLIIDFICYKNGKA